MADEARRRQGAANRRKLMAERLRHAEAQAVARAKRERAVAMQEEAKRRQEEEMAKRTDDVRVRYVGYGTHPPSQAELDEQERNASTFNAERDRVEREAVQRERTAELIAFYARGGLTDRQRAAQEYLRYLNMLAEGGWQSANSEWASRGTVQDDARALTAIGDAARQAVKETVGRFIEGAERELADATEEHAAIIARGYI